MFTRLLLLALSLIFISQSTFSQSIWAPDLNGSYVRVAWVKPSLDIDFFGYRYDDMTFPSGNLYINGGFPLSRRLRLHLEIPMVSYGGRVSGALFDIAYPRNTDFSETNIGNPLVSVEHVLTNVSTLEYGLRLPIMKESPMWSFRESDPAMDYDVISMAAERGDMHRDGAFSPEYMYLNALYRYTFRFEGALHRVMLRGGIVGILSMEGRDGNAYGRSSVSAEWIFDRMLMNAGLFANFNPDFFDSEVGIMAGYVVGNIVPAVGLRIPLITQNSYTECDYAIDFSVSYRIAR